MEIIDQLAVALGFATLAGLNLYLTVLITGLAIRFNWIALAEQYEQLSVLGSPVVLAAAGVFFLAEFFSDKIPWVDSAWDTVHTLIRPIGGAILATKTLGATDPAFDVIIALLAGSATLVTHGVKAGTRLAVNTSPEPVSNIIVSTAEDTAVVGGLALMAFSPLLAGVVFVVFLGFAVYLTPILFRRVRAVGWLVFQKLSAPADGDTEGDGHAKGDPFNGSLHSDEHLALRAGIGAREPDIRWVARCVTGRAKSFPGIGGQTFGKLVAEGDRTDTLQMRFIGRRRWRHNHAEVPLDGLHIQHESRLLSEDVVLSGLEEKPKRRLVLRFPRGQRAIARKVAEEMLSLQKSTAAPLVEEQAAELAVDSAD